MKYFKIFYKYISNEVDILADSYDKGLEFRLGGFFYDSQIKGYKKEFRERLIKVREECCKELQELSTFEEKMLLLQCSLAVTLYRLQHPIKAYKARKQFKNSRKR